MEWFERAESNRDKLVALLSVYHPVVHHKSDMKVTAPNAQKACDIIIRQLANNPNPVEQFDEALELGDIRTINRLLNEAWFGVPESTQCWNIEGFKEAVELLEDFPEPNEMN